MPAMASAERPDLPSPSDLPPIPSSPAFTYASTANPLSSYDLPLPPPPRPSHAVLTKSDLEQSHLAYSDLIATAKAYRIALANLSTASSAFGSALESCARLKEARAEALHTSSARGGPPMTPQMMTNSFTANGGRLAGLSSGACTADLIMSASGVQHLIANHQQILSETVYRSFEVPLLDEMDKWRREIADEEEHYQSEVQTRSKEIRKLEKEGLKLHKQRRRDLVKFREHLVTLTGKLDGLTGLQGEHSRTLLRESQLTSGRIVEASCSLVRAEVDIFESLARKGWTGGGLDDLLEKGRDLFASEDDALGGTAAMMSQGGAGAGAHVGGQGIVSTGNGAADGGAQLFSILPPKSILADSSGAGASANYVEYGAAGRGRPRGHGRADSLLVESDVYQSLAGAVGSDDRTDTESIFSEFNQSRGVRPFSPQPIRRAPTDVVMDPESLPISEYSDRTIGAHGGRSQQDDDDRMSAMLRGEEDSMNICAPGLSIDEREEEDEEAVSPWKNEGLDRRRGGDGDEEVEIESPATIRHSSSNSFQGQHNDEDSALLDYMTSKGHDEVETHEGSQQPEESRKSSRWSIMR